MMKKLTLQWRIVFIVGAVFIAIVVSRPVVRPILRDLRFGHLAPPQGVSTLKEFAAASKPPTALFVATAEEDEVIVWMGESGGGLIPASGPACYVFDTKGNLMTWFDETGNEAGGTLKCSLVKQKASAKFISVDAALELISSSDRDQT